ncbi:helix-turn-helix transcriptional regulator [Nocardia salmonicida]|uniref:helix-turn-helix domain-containing protein n=1 Tax=Nocardia salmonicida TaxID=53431 RepID=UPI003441E2AC
MTEDDAAVRKRIGAIVQRRRADLQLSANGLARKAGVNIRTLSNLESGDSWPWESNRSKIEQALGLASGFLEQLRTDPVRIDGVEESLQNQDRDRGWIAKPEGGRRFLHQFNSAPNLQSRGGASEQLRAANVAAAAERLALLPAEDIARVQDLIDELGRARFADWNDNDADYELAWNRRAKLAPLSAADEQEVIDSLDDVD